MPVSRGSRSLRLALLASVVGAALPLHATEQSDDEKLSAAITRSLGEEGVPSAAVALVSDDQLTFTAGFGEGPQGPATPASLYRVGALSELVVALVALRLAERGVVDLEAKVLDLVPGLSIENPWEATQPLLLAHLLEHTSGLEELLPRERISEDPLSPLLPLRALVALRPRTVRWEPGTRASFSSANLTLAALALETAAKTPLPELARREVFEPLGLFGTSYASDEARQSLTIGAYRGAAGADARPLHWAARGLLSSARDLGLLVRVLTAGGSPGGEPFLRPGSIERLARGRTLPVSDQLHGPAFSTLAVFDDGFWAQARLGDTPGALCEVRWYPREHKGYALLIGDGAGQEARTRIGLLVRRHLLKTVRPPEPPPRVDVPREQLSRRVGFWASVSPSDRLTAPLERLFGDAELRVEERPDGAANLRLRVAFGSARTLLALGSDVFRVEGEQQPTVAFVSAASGKPRMMLRGALFEQHTVPEALWMRLRLALAVLTLLGLASALALALWWVPRALLGVAPESADLRLRALPVLSALVLLAWALVRGVSTQELGRVNLTSVLLWLLPLAWTALSLATLLFALRAVPQHGGQARRLVWMHSFFVAVLSCGFAGFLAWNGLLGIRTWAL